jgi:hypothetical protein
MLSEHAFGFSSAQRRIKQPFLCPCVHFKKRPKPSPNGGQRIGVASIDLFEDRENPALSVA